MLSVARRLAPVLILPWLFLAPGCALIDPAQVEICRAVLGALHPEGSAIGEIRASLAEDGVRIDYRARIPGESPRAHHVVCRFGRSGGAPIRPELVAIETEQGPLSDVRLLFLKRFWLGAGRATAPDPVSARLTLPFTVAIALQQVVNALALSGIYALLATTYSLVYGLIGKINLAFGELAVIGGYGAVVAVGLAGALGGGGPIGLLVAAGVLAALLAGLWSALVGVFVVAPLHERHRRGQPVLVATLGAAIAIQEGLRLVQGPRERWLPPFFNQPLTLAEADGFLVTVTPMALFAALAALSAACGLLLIMAHTRFGRAWRAFADDPVAAALFGVSPARLLATTFLLAGVLAGFAGWIATVHYGTIGASHGTLIGLKALAAAILGGIGSLPGAFLGGLLVGLFEGLWSAYFGLAVREIALFALLVAVLVLKPGGLLGAAGPKPREI